MAKLPQIYERKFPVLRRAKARLRSILEKVIARIEDKKLVRANIRMLRIKKLSSVQRKADKNGWSETDALWLCSDLIGARVVCNNIEDVYRFAALLKERLDSPGTKNFKEQDYIINPQEGGYRALHVDFRLDLGEYRSKRDRIPCEVQIQSRLQDTWAVLTHDDIYKQPDIPEDLRARAKDIAEVLSAADKIASDIRTRAMREISFPAHPPDMRRISRAGLAYSFRFVFGRSPGDYVIRLARDLCKRLHITTLEKFPELLARPAFRARVEKAYRSILGLGIGNEDVFLAALYALAKDDEKAIEWAEEEARRERREIEQSAMREMLSSLPDTLEDLIEELGDPRGEPDVETWADALGATSACMMCGETIVRPSSFAEAIVDHYEVSEDDIDDARERIEQAILSSGIEIGGWNIESLCAYHDGKWAKDD